MGQTAALNTRQTEKQTESHGGPGAEGRGPEPLLVGACRCAGSHWRLTADELDPKHSGGPIIARLTNF